MGKIQILARKASFLRIKIYAQEPVILDRLKIKARPIESAGQFLSSNYSYELGNKPDQSAIIGSRFKETDMLLGVSRHAQSVFGV